MEINGVTTIKMGDVIDFLVPVTGTVDIQKLLISIILVSF